MKIGKIVETSIYSTNLEDMKDFYVNKLGLEFVSEQQGRHVFIKTDNNMLLIFNHEITITENETSHGASTPPSVIHIAFEIDSGEYDTAKKMLIESNIQIEKEIEWGNRIGSKSIYFRDPAGNLVEFITKNYWELID
ncbi:MAG TPA: VOC family protein [Nitrososphaeraceae archaeon]|nr:VOC family protein [Nitrososphaeraceae archaeon]